MALPPVVDLLQETVSLLRRLVEVSEVEPLRGLGPEDLLTEEEVSRYVRIQRSEVRAWLVRVRCPRALSPGKRKIALYRVCDVRRALEHGTAVDDDQAWEALS